MEFEYQNTHLRSRKKLILKGLALLAVFLIFFFCKYYFAPPDYQSGLKSNRTWFSYNGFRWISILAVVIFIPAIFFSRIVLRVKVSSSENKLSVDLVKRFRWSVSTVEVKLSETQIQYDHQEETKSSFLRNRPEYFILHLINEKFGTISISSTEFKNLGEIVGQFEGLKRETAKKIRVRRRKSRS